MKTNFKKIICSLMVIAPTAFATIPLASCNHETPKVINHNLISIKTLALDSVVSNFDEINFENLKATNKVEVKVIAEINHWNYEMEVTHTSNTPDTIIVELHISNYNLHLEKNTQATLHETVFIDNKIVDTKNIDVLITTQSFTKNFVDIAVVSQTVNSDKKTNIATFISSYKNVDRFAFVSDQKTIPLEGKNNEILANFPKEDSDYKLTGYIEAICNGKPYDSKVVTITVQKTDTVATFTKIDAPTGKGGSEITIGTFKTEFGSLGDIKDAKLITKNNKEIKVKIASDGKATITSAKTDKKIILVGTLSAKVEGKDQTFDDLSIIIQKTDIIATFTKIDAPKGKGGDEIVIGTFKADFGQLADIRQAKLITKNNEEIKVDIFVDGKAAITHAKTDKEITLVGTLFAKVKGNDQTFEDLSITILKNDTVATFTKIDAPTGKGGSEITIGTFNTDYGSLGDIKEAKFITKANEEIKVEIDADGKATITHTKTNKEIILVGTLSAKVEGIEQTFDELSITILKNDTVATFTKIDAPTGKGGSEITIGTFKTDYGSLGDIKEAKFITKANEEIKVEIDADGKATITPAKTDKEIIVVGTLSAKVEGKDQTFDELSITVLKNDTVATFTKFEDPKGKAGSEIAIGTFKTDFGQITDITEAKITTTDVEISPEKVKIASDGTATITPPKADRISQAFWTLSAEVEGKTQTFGKLQITIQKTDTEATFTKTNAPKGKGGTQITIGTFKTNYGSLDDIKETKFITKANEEIKVEIDAAGKAIIIPPLTDKEIILTGTLSAKVAGKDQTFDELSITVRYSYTVATFTKAEDLKGKAGSEIVIGTFKTEFGPITDITEAYIYDKSSEHKCFITIAADGKATITPALSDKNTTLVGTISAKVEGKTQTFGELSITIQKTDTVATFTKAKAPKGKAGSEVVIGTFKTEFGPITDITEAFINDKTISQECFLTIAADGKATIKIPLNATNKFEGILWAKVNGWYFQRFSDINDNIIVIIENS